MTGITADQIRRFLEKSRHTTMAVEVHRHWPAVRAGIENRFADLLVTRISERLKEQLPLDLCCEHSVTGHDRPKWQAIRVFRDGDAWRVKGSHRTDNRVDILMEAPGPGPDGWKFGIRTGGQPAEVRDALSSRLSEILGPGEKLGAWPWQREVADRWRWWHRIVPELAQELTNEGEATHYFVDWFTETCQLVVPIIDELVPTAAKPLENRAKLNELVRGRLRLSSPSWAVSPSSERLRLYKADHWSEIAFSGVWFMWDEDAFKIGIEWPKEGVASLDKQVRECFLATGVEVSRPRMGGGDWQKGRRDRRPETWWLHGSLRAEAWRWEKLADKSHEELNDYADAVVDLMTKLAGVIDAAEKTEIR